MPTHTTATKPTLPRRAAARTITVTVIAAVLSLALVVTGARLLVTGWFDPKDGGIHRFQDLAWGVIEGVILLVGVAPQLWRPARQAAAVQQALAGMAALAVTMALFRSADLPTIAAGVLLLVLVVVHPARAEVFRAGGRPDRARLALALLGAVPLLIYALHQVSLMRATPAGSPLAQSSGFGGACAAAVGVILVALLAAVRAGALLPGCSAAAAALLLGAGSIAFPYHPSSLGQAGGAAATAGALLFLAATLRASRRSRVNYTPTVSGGCLRPAEPQPRPRAGISTKERNPS